MNQSPEMSAAVLHGKLHRPINQGLLFLIRDHTSQPLTMGGWATPARWRPPRRDRLTVDRCVGSCFEANPTRREERLLITADQCNAEVMESSDGRPWRPTPQSVR